MGIAAAIILGVLGLVGVIGGTVASVAQNRINREDTQEFDAEQAEITRDYNAEEAEKVRDFNAEEAQKNRDWQEYMASTAMQRQKADYQAAGINLGALGGSPVTTSYSGSTGSGSNAFTAPTAASNALVGLGSGSGINSVLNSVITNATKATLKKNAKELGDEVEDEMVSNARRESERQAILKEQAEREQYYKDHPEVLEKELAELDAIL